MQTINSISALRKTIQAHKKEGKTIGFVPTMGNLHQGHLSLIKNVQSICDVVITSIFVNPLQFSDDVDFSTYPKTLESDQVKLKQVSNDILFVPTELEIYPTGKPVTTYVTVPEMDTILCGKSRIGHLTGVATVVTKLLNIVQPYTAIFGEKDYQQLMVIKQLVQDLNIPTKIIGSPTVRAKNGLALSSRNALLNPNQIDIASRLYQILQIVKQSILAGETNFREIENQTMLIINESGFIADYFEIRTQTNLKLATKEDKDIVILVAAQIDKIRLIDNIQFSLDV